MDGLPPWVLGLGEYIEIEKAFNPDCVYLSVFHSNKHFEEQGIIVGIVSINDCKTYECVCRYVRYLGTPRNANKA